MKTHQHPQPQFHFSLSRFSEKIRDSTKRTKATPRTAPYVYLDEALSQASQPPTPNPRSNGHGNESPHLENYTHHASKPKSNGSDPTATATTTNKNLLAVPSDPHHAPVPSSDTATASEKQERRRSSVANYTSQLLALFAQPSSTQSGSKPHKSISKPRLKAKSKKNLASDAQTTLLSLPRALLVRILAYLPFYSLVRCRAVCGVLRGAVPGEDGELAERLYLGASGARGMLMEMYGCMFAVFDLEFESGGGMSAECGGGAGSEEVGGGMEDAGRSGSGGGSGSGTTGASEATTTRTSTPTPPLLTMTRRSQGLVRMSEEILFHPIIIDFNHFVTKPGFLIPEKMETETLEKETDAGTMTDGSGGGVNYSWRDMLVSMPPLREIRIRHGRTGGVVRMLRVEEGEGEGVTLGMLFDALREWGGE